MSDMSDGSHRSVPHTGSHHSVHLNNQKRHVVQGLGWRVFAVALMPVGLFGLAFLSRMF